MNTSICKSLTYLVDNTLARYTSQKLSSFEARQLKVLNLSFFHKIYLIKNIECFGSHTALKLIRYFTKYQNKTYTEQYIYNSLNLSTICSQICSIYYCGVSRQTLTAKRKLERRQFSTSSSFVKI